jgi:Tfp pilus assembly protein PilE
LGGKKMADSNALKKEKKFSLIELIMIVMVVGIVFTLVIPLRNDYVYKERMSEAIRNIQIIARANVEFKNNPDNGYYAFDLGMLNVKENLVKYTDDFLFEYSLSDSSTVVATSNKNFGKEGAIIFYFLPTGPWQLGKNKATKNTLNSNWLP